MSTWRLLLETVNTFILVVYAFKQHLVETPRAGFKLSLAVVWQNRVQAIFNLAESSVWTFIFVKSVKRAES